MLKVSSENFREILKNDGFAYVQTLKTTQPLDLSFPNLPDWHMETFESYDDFYLPDADVICFEYKGSNY